MPKNKIEDLRNILFETMEKLMDDDDPMDLDRAEAVGKVAQVIVNSAKVEVDFIKTTGHGGSSFIQGTMAATQEPLKLAQKPLPAIDVIASSRPEDLCQSCVLPDCDESSTKCLIQIKREQEKLAA